MKRALLAAILGTGAVLVLAGNSQAQGFIVFNTYGVGHGYVSYNGAALDNTFTAQVYYALTDVTGSISFANTISAPSGGGLTLLPDTANFADTGAGSSALTGVGLTIPGYTSGLVTFVVVVYNGADFATSTLRAHSLAFTETLATGNTSPSQFSNLQDFQIVPIPEPSTMALAGLGAASMLFLRRRK